MLVVSPECLSGVSPSGKCHNRLSVKTYRGLKLFNERGYLAHANQKNQLFLLIVLASTA